MKFVRLSLLMTLLLTVLSACGAPAQSSADITAAPADPTAAPAGAELVIVGQEIAAGLDPVHELTSAYLRGVGAGEALMKVQADGTVAPELALSITQRTTATWTIALRPGVTFWSGAPVDAAAVRASLERSRALDAQAAPFLEGMTFTVIDPLTLEVATATPNPMTPFNLSYYQLLIHNAATYGESANPFDLTAMDLTGPFKVTEFAPKQSMVLEANPGYWGAKPALARIRHEEVKDAQARVLAAQSGQADVVTGVPAEAAATLQHDPAVTLVPVPAANTTTVYLNLQSAALRDVRVRQAI
ncbi:MAG TPA: ABC transporter substrate-binding protein, partial [Herpetosiphonaceae bacterium]|nr:ABC transporter substrate-binding protein [Herpetosiphonaceae bacterium]